MSKKVTHLILEIDLTNYAEDARFTVAKKLAAKALNLGLVGPEDLASLIYDILNEDVPYQSFDSLKIEDFIAQAKTKVT